MQEKVAGAPEASLRFAYILTLADYAAMSEASAGRVSQWLSRWAFWPLVLVNAAMGTVLIYHNWNKGAFDWAFVFNLAIAAALLLARYFLKPLLLRWTFKQTRLGGRNTTVSFGADSVELSATGLSSTIHRNEIERFNESPGHFFFWFNPRQAIIVPKRAVQTEDAADALRAYGAPI